MLATASAVKQYKSFNQTEDINTLWIIYSSNSNPAIKEKLLINYLPMVKFVVGRMMLTLPNSVNYDDMVSAGTMGLLAAIDRFDIKVGVKFETFQLARNLILYHRKHLGEKIRIVAGSALVIADTFLNHDIKLSVFDACLITR